MKEHWAMFAMGVWLAGTILVSVVATENFYTIDRLLAQSSSNSLTTIIGTLGHLETRNLLRYLSSELNRLYFQLWNVTQLLIGIVVLWLLAGNRSVSRARWGVLGMVALVVLMIAWLTPQIVSVGRSLDFVPRTPTPPALGRFGMLHGLYTSLEACKLVVGVLVTFWIGRGAPVGRPGVVVTAGGASSMN